MPNSSDPPRPSLRSDVRNYLVGCVWDSGQQRVEDGSGNPVAVWLNQDGTPGITNPVRWEVGTTSSAGVSVQATIPSATFNMIKNGGYDQSTGLVSYQGKNYRFLYQMNQGVPSMVPLSV